MLSTETSIYARMEIQQEENSKTGLEDKSRVKMLPLVWQSTQTRYMGMPETVLDIALHWTCLVQNVDNVPWLAAFCSDDQESVSI